MLVINISTLFTCQLIFYSSCWWKPSPVKPLLLKEFKNFPITDVTDPFHLSVRIFSYFVTHLKNKLGIVRFCCLTRATEIMQLSKRSNRWTWTLYSYCKKPMLCQNKTCLSLGSLKSCRGVGWCSWTSCPYSSNTGVLALGQRYQAQRRMLTCKVVCLGNWSWE